MRLLRYVIQIIWRIILIIYFSIVKSLITTGCLLAYLAASLYQSWIMVDFYWHRDDYTQQYCKFLDEGMTMCRASCYLSEQLQPTQEGEREATIKALPKIKTAQIEHKASVKMAYPTTSLREFSIRIEDFYQYEEVFEFFRPPKG